MLVCILKSKIHRATVTAAEIDYSGSISIDKNLMERANILPYEKVLVVSLDSGERLETYAIEGERGSGEICMNGAAARKILRGEKIIILSFIYIEYKEALEYRPKIVYVDEKNKITGEKNHVLKDDQC
ncbi:MAG: aspartate 1-decarboxylase [Actinomycetota bacterium]|jgi:aspartate 1-decarboxylase|nr:aspartate 1-decarboxylase [Actinomycetota bacterium]MDD5600409.1 aspartate 1-decarboxylase [Actinomycetota bacterium]